MWWSNNNKINGGFKRTRNPLTLQNAFVNVQLRTPGDPKVFSRGMLQQQLVCALSPVSHIAWIISGLTTTATKIVAVCMFAGLLKTQIRTGIIIGTLQRHNFAAATASEMDQLSPTSDRQMSFNQSAPVYK